MGTFQPPPLTPSPTRQGAQQWLDGHSLAEAGLWQMAGQNGHANGIRSAAGLNKPRVQIASSRLPDKSSHAKGSGIAFRHHNRPVLLRLQSLVFICKRIMRPTMTSPWQHESH